MEKILTLILSLKVGSCEYFVVKEIKLNGEKSFTADEKSYHALIVVDGNLDICGDGFFMNVKLGETVFIPATTGEYTLIGNATVLKTTNPIC